jgi:hypothetical protein
LQRLSLDYESALSAEDRAILEIRGHRVMLDATLADLYGVETGALVRAVRRNAERFPGDFMFQVSEDELNNLRCQTGISSSWGGRRYRPYAFTEHGVAMLSSVLRSALAAQVNIEIMRAFVRNRQLLQANVELASKLDSLEKRYDSRADGTAEETDAANWFSVGLNWTIDLRPRFAEARQGQNATTNPKTNVSLTPALPPS